MAATVGEERRRQILAAAATRFARDGFHGASMQEICREAGLSPGSVYRYFRSKDEIIAALVEEDRAASVALIEAVRDGGNTLTALGALAETIFGELADPTAAALYAEILAEATRNPVVAALARRYDESVAAALAEAIVAGQHRGEVNTALAAPTLARILISLFDGLAVRKGLDPDLDLSTYQSVIARLFDRALRPDADGEGERSALPGDRSAP